ncbi:aminotransferase class V-fold PLP-dependent enzyme [Paenibacillus albiflavus]|uniref:cysteine desulfurase n=1 Tax=Paenibacillus albiflavus TaxID=2545760 RepID=A0A4V2WNJ8_9BACL|nr:aminotransferase class V-fold PLP-dependent enzyme [Paenibacillus albiflavus]TCZ75672.1 aminotransferase class V-fold PLP-dependent enzyme [Paenibacillus albiflavus]
MRYLDNAASSWPKPPSVMEAMMNSMNESTAGPGRGSHSMSLKTSRVVFDARKNAAKLFGVRNPNDIAFTMNTTMSLNLAINGFVREGDHVVCTMIEHNSVRRPLEHLKRTRNVSVTYVPADTHGNIQVADVTAAIRPETTLCVVAHSSNLLGTIVDVPGIGALCRSKGVRLLVDAAQSAGILPIHVDQMGIDMLAFPGHKGLMGPQGTGGLYIHPELELEPLLYGGTGSQSEEIDQPRVRPDRYEAGTHNTVGLAGLSAGIKFVLEQTVEEIYKKEWALTQRLMEGLGLIEGIHVLGPKIGQAKTGIVAFNVKNVDSSEIAFILDQSFEIAVRSGYHCTPLSHESIGTLEQGAVRASVGFYTTIEDIDALIDAVKDIAANYA